MNLSMFKIRQHFETAPAIVDPYNATKKALDGLRGRVRPGMSICVAVGSRGICGIDVITRAAIDVIRSRGAHPFIIPAMGSHGGATAAGQQEVLDGYGVSEAAMGVPIIAEMDVVKLAVEDDAYRLYISRPALAADGIIIINRIKPHTDYHGLYESGLVKMSVIGLGKHAQALEMHRFGVRGLRELMPRAAERIFATGKVLGGIAVVENTADRPACIEAVPVERILEREPELLAMAVKNMPRLPVDEIDVLAVDYVGKDYSGTGLDTNIIGRMRIRGEPEPLRPSIKAIVIADLSEKSHGNALGIGFADVITRRLHEKIDFEKMYENAFTSTFFERVKVPMVAPTDADAIRRALRTCGPLAPGTERVARIRNTLEIEELYVSESIMRSLDGCNNVEVVSGPVPLCTGETLSAF